MVGGTAKRRRGCGRVRVATDNSTSTNSVADDYYEVLGLVILPKPEFWSCSVDEKIWKTKRKSIFYVLRFCFLSENYISLKLDQLKKCIFLEEKKKKKTFGSVVVFYLFLLE